MIAVNYVREYSLLAVLGVVGVLLLEAFVLRTGLLKTRAYWTSMAICYAFMIAVNGWLTKRSAPIVRYHEGEFSTLRFPWDIPVEDYLFGFALLTLTMLLWDTLGRRQRLSGTET
jgi:lycopene cyclase domain-containing protein